MLKQLLEDFVERKGVVFTHSGRYTNTNNSCFIFDEDNVFSGMKVDLYSPASGCIKNDEDENLWQVLNKEDNFYKIYTGQKGQELQNLLLQLCKSEVCLKDLPQVYFKTEDDYEIIVPVGSAHNLKHGTDYLWEHKYYKTYNHKLGGSNPQNCSHACNKMRGGFKAFNTTPMTVEED